MSARAGGQVAVIGAGPAGLMAAERLAAAGLKVTVIERMASVARKFLMAGRGGLNLTHAEDETRFLARYGACDSRLIAAVQAFPAAATVAWANGLGQPTFIGTSGRVFPKSMKASPLLRAWLARLADCGVEIRTRTAWCGFAGVDELWLARAGGAPQAERFDAVVLALGGASWPRLGADGAWRALLTAEDVPVTPLQAANVGVRIAWSAHMLRHAGQPLKRIAVTVGPTRVRGEAVVTRAGLEGGAIYAAGAALRSALGPGGATIHIDFKPDMPVGALTAKLAAVPTKQSLANVLRKAAALDPVAVALLQERAPGAPPPPRDAAALAARIKAVPVPVAGFQGLERAISTAGGLAFEALDARFMLKVRPGVFAAGEMLDWTAPTGGYLLQACLATGVAAADGVIAWLQGRERLA